MLPVLPSADQWCPGVLQRDHCDELRAPGRFLLRALERALCGAAELRARGAQAGEARQHVQRGAVVRPPRRAGGLGRQEEVARGVRQPPVGRTTLDTTRCHVNCQVKLF